MKAAKLKENLNTRFEIFEQRVIDALVMITRKSKIP